MAENTAHSRLIALRALEHNPAWPVYCARHKEIVEKQIDAKIFDVATSDEECRILRKARAVLAESYSPEKMLKNMLVQAETEASHEAREREKAAQKK